MKRDKGKCANFMDDCALTCGECTPANITTLPPTNITTLPPTNVTTLPPPTVITQLSQYT